MNGDVLTSNEMQTQQQQAWTDRLPVGVIATISTMLDVGSVGNLAVTTCLEVSQAIRVAYIKDNMSLIRRAVTSDNNRKRELLVGTWLDVNEDWAEYFIVTTQDKLSDSDRATFDTVFNDLELFVDTDRLDVVRYLVEVRGIDVNGPCSVSGLPPLFHAAQRPTTKMLDYFLSLDGFDVMAQTVEIRGWTSSILHSPAVLRGPFVSLENMRLLLFHDSVDVNSTAGPKGMTPIHRALRLSAPLDKLRLLLSHEEMDLSVGNEHGSPPLHVALDNYVPLDIFRLLLEHAQDVGVTNAYGLTVLSTALLVPWVMLEKLELLLAHESVDVNFADERDATALHYALVSPSDDSIQKLGLLLEHKSLEVNAQVLGGSTALHYAATLDSAPLALEKMRILLSRVDVDVNVGETTSGRTALHLAIISRNLQTARLLVEFGADCHAQDFSGETPLALSSRALSLSTSFEWMLLD